MKTNFTGGGCFNRGASRRRFPWVLVVLGALALGTWPLPQAQAVIPEPDNIVYGQIWLGTNEVHVTAQDTNVVVEARHLGDTNVLSSYRMGGNPAFGDFYVVEIHLGIGDVLLGLAAPTNGSVLDLVVTEGAAELAQTNFTVGGPTLSERGYVQRIDFGTVPTNVLTGFDAWAAAWGIGDGNQDMDGDGQSNYAEYLAGTNPTNRDSAFRLTITASNMLAVVSFDALRAGGAGYEGRTRYYSLQSTTNAALGLWSTAGSYTNILGDNQTVSYIQPAANGVTTFFRGLVELRGP